MESENHTFLQVLRIPHGELWYSRDSDLVFSSEGDVQVLFSQPLNQFILRLHDFKVILDKSIPIISSIVGRHQRQAYILPRGTGFSMIRLADGKSSPALQNFETILDNTSSFSRKSGLDSTLASYKELREGGFTESILKTFESVSKALAPTSDNDSHPNQRIVRSFEELTDLDSHGTSVVDITEAELASLSKKNELDTAGSQSGDVWGRFTGENTTPLQSKPSGQSEPTKQSPPSGESGEMKEGHQRTSDIEQPAAKSKEENVELSETKGHQPTCRYHPSIDHQEVVGAQEQRLPSYEVHNSKEFLRTNLRKASTNFQPSDLPEEQEEKPEENVELPEPEHFEDEAFTFGLLTKDHRQASNISEQSVPVSSEDAFTDLTHPMRKFSSVDRPFLNIDDETPNVEADKPKNEGHSKGFTGQPIITAKGQPNLRSNIDDQPSPISNTEKYSTEPTQPEKSSFSKSNTSDAQPMQPSNTVGQQNIVRESSQGNETKKHKKVTAEPVDKENLRSPTAI